MGKVAPEATPERCLSNAQYFFELGFFAAWGKAAQANGTADEPMRPLFELSDDLCQREWDGTPCWVADPEEYGRRVAQEIEQEAEIARLRAALEQAADNLLAAAKLHQCPGAQKAEQLARQKLAVQS